MATEYRQKLAVITALQYTGTNAQDVISFGNGRITNEEGILKLSGVPAGVGESSVINVTDWVGKGPTLVISSMPNALFIASFEPNT